MKNHFYAITGSLLFLSLLFMSCKKDNLQAPDAKKQYTAGVAAQIPVGAPEVPVPSLPSDQPPAGIVCPAHAGH
ncbi:MAG TPA: hypothetical protein VMH01_02555 [Puia sp.]|nr:hypothetical protein [Puia sp.]